MWTTPAEEELAQGHQMPGLSPAHRCCGWKLSPEETCNGPLPCADRNGVSQPLAWGKKIAGPSGLPLLLSAKSTAEEEVAGWVCVEEKKATKEYISSFYFIFCQVCCTITYIQQNSPFLSVEFVKFGQFWDHHSHHKWCPLPQKMPLNLTKPQKVPLNLTKKTKEQPMW